MKISAIILAIMSLVLMAMVMAEAAAIKKNDKARKNVHEKNEGPVFRSNRKSNPDVLPPSKERFTSCGNPSKDAFRIDSITSSRHLCSGCKACIDIGGLLKERIENGTKIQLEVTKFIFTVYSKTFDLCDTLETLQEGPRCPIEPTTQGLHVCFPLAKSLTTDIGADIKLTAITAAKKTLFCINGAAMIESKCPKDVGPGSDACNH